MSRELKIFVLMYAAGHLISGIMTYILWKGSWDIDAYFKMVMLTWADKAACALWLWMFARRERWLWALFGFVGHLYAIIIFLVVERLALPAQQGSAAQTS